VGTDLFEPLDEWPKSWAGVEDDERLGHGLVAPMRAFLSHLLEQGLSRKTLHRHRTSLWVIGGEIIRAVHDDDSLRKQPPHQLLLDAIEHGEAPLVYRVTEADQRSFDATARKLLRFLTTER
jgi:hypothetical protein